MLPLHIFQTWSEPRHTPRDFLTSRKLLWRKGREQPGGEDGVLSAEAEVKSQLQKSSRLEHLKRFGCIPCSPHLPSSLMDGPPYSTLTIKSTHQSEYCIRNKTLSNAKSANNRRLRTGRENPDFFRPIWLFGPDNDKVLNSGPYCKAWRKWGLKLCGFQAFRPRNLFLGQSDWLSHA